eukprot:1163487-Amphidinium_carterae.1
MRPVDRQRHSLVKQVTTEGLAHVARTIPTASEIKVCWYVAEETLTFCNPAKNVCWFDEVLAQSRQGSGIGQANQVFEKPGSGEANSALPRHADKQVKG